MREIILRLIQKDDRYIYLIESFFIEIYQKIKDLNLVPRTFNLNSNVFHKLSLILYYLFSYKVGGLDTLGEEYCQMKKSNTGFVYLFARIFKTEIIKRILSLAKRILAKTFSYFKFTKISLLLDSLFTYNEDNMPELIAEIEITLFFLFGKNLDLSCRVFRSSYDQISETENNSIFNEEAFIFLGCLCSYKLIYKFISHIKNGYKEIFDKQVFSTKSDDKSAKLVIKTNKSKKQNKECILCLDSVVVATTTLCGHIFCWACISEYLQDNPKCPKCRQQNFPQNLILV